MKHTRPAALILISLFVTSCSSDEIQIRIRKEHSVRSLLSPHAEPSVTMIAGTNTIHYVLGHPPYYLKVPQWNSVFVATESKDHKFYYHVISLNDYRDTIIDGKGTSFGYYIGEPNGIEHEFVAMVDDLRLMLTRRGDKRQISYLLDMKEKRAVSMTIEDLDSEGKVTRGTANEVK